ncbi:tRNA (guanine(46)-N(7))-methyltransferase TrmB [Thalassotalea sp. PLHSN55]|uniref:tRNA (guanine(46)-N(7))-methyltransferase TrmB n=1 Tax=Thalassotalea sp. PLHSN55 TaxID=3435888 RepID=UPI003F82B604
MTQTQAPMGDSKAIISNQPGVHEKLDEIVRKHLAHRSKKPYQAHTEQAFNEMNAIVENFDGEIILDSCCGVGQSTRILAKQNPDALVIGIDKSAHRINRNIDDVWQADNYHLIRADLNDFYRLVAAANWPVSKHYILYPNPWPKAKHIQRRWHGSAVFPEIISIGSEIILRSNWPIYLQEFQQAAAIAGRAGQLTQVNEAEPLTPFEAKYQASGQTCWQLRVE